MSGPTEEIRRLAHEVVKDGIVTIAAERLITQIVEVCADHERDSIEAMRRKCETIARGEDDGSGTEADGRARRIADRIAALAQAVRDKAA
jgi:hypothetical protein